jgi:hypothetical protein
MEEEVFRTKQRRNAKPSRNFFGRESPIVLTLFRRADTMRGEQVTIFLYFEHKMQ